jgi:hypothetical protein
VERVITRGETQRARIASYREHVELQQFTHKVLSRHYEWSIRITDGVSWRHINQGWRDPDDKWIEVRLRLIAILSCLDQSQGGCLRLRGRSDQRRGA